MALLVALIPLGTGALLVPQEREDAQNNLQQAIGKAAQQYRSRTVVTEATAEEAHNEEVQLQRLAREKRVLRLRVADLRWSIDALRSAFDIDPADAQARTEAAEAERAAFLLFLRGLHAHNAAWDSDFSGVFRRLLTVSLGALTEQDMRDRILAQSRATFLSQLLTAGERVEELAAAEEELAALQDAYRKQQSALAVVSTVASTVGGDRTEEIKQIEAEVHAQVLKMQSELARIDARLRRRAERSLIDKGLLPAQPGKHTDGIVDFTPQFAWPTYGPISAGFLDSAYRERFGVPHRGMDIVVSQGSPVASAAEGIVFITKDGGARGYSYVLVGHRGGYATLYGHLLHIGVSAGQELSQGQAIGASGGDPGTPGSGPMTTGPHLHFEVIKNGVNINPRTVLP